MGFRPLAAACQAVVNLRPVVKDIRDVRRRQPYPHTWPLKTDQRHACVYTSVSRVLWTGTRLHTLLLPGWSNQRQVVPERFAPE